MTTTTNMTMNTNNYRELVPLIKHDYDLIVENVYTVIEKLDEDTVLYSHFLQFPDLLEQLRTSILELENSQIPETEEVLEIRKLCMMLHSINQSISHAFYSYNPITNKFQSSLAESLKDEIVIIH